MSNETESLKPLYMSQTEANAVMELWARRQQEEAARQSMVTVHDVAEATQLSQLEVEKLLSEIRSEQDQSAEAQRRSRPRDRSWSVAHDEISLLVAYQRLSSYLAVLCALLGLFLHAHVENWARETNYSAHYQNLENFCFFLWFYAVVTLTPVISRSLLIRLVRLSDLASLRREANSTYGKR